jgi:hypothetical protein
MWRNLLCRIGFHQWVVGSSYQLVSTLYRYRECKNCARKEKGIFWWGTCQGIEVLEKGSLRK